MSKKPLTRKELRRAYAQCVEWERKREVYTRTTPQGAFERSLVHLDELPHDDEMPTGWASDGGQGVERMIEAIDGPQRGTREQAIQKAQMKVIRQCPHRLPVFWLVLKNGTNRKESICELVKTMPTAVITGRKCSISATCKAFSKSLNGAKKRPKKPRTTPKAHGVGKMAKNASRYNK